MIYTIDHVTRVTYQNPVRLARFNIRLRPIVWPGQTVTDFSLSVNPVAAILSDRSATCPVNISRVVISERFSTLIVRSRFTAEVEEHSPDMLPEDLTIAQLSRAALDSPSLAPAAPGPYIFRSTLLPPVPEIADWASAWLHPDRSAFDSALALCRHIYQDFIYDGDATEADTPVASAFAIRRGVCQDFAHILIAALRSAGLPAAYVSGYLRTVPPPGKARLVGADAMHAWAALWCGPHRGWVGLDPTNGVVTGSGHIVVAMGRDYADVSPIDGVVIGGGEQYLSTSVDVVPEAEMILSR